MSATAQRALAAARRRQAAIWLLKWTPWLALALFEALRWHLPLGAGLFALAVGIALLQAWRALRRLDRRWLIRALDAGVPALQDSSDLLFAPAGSLAPLARVQQARIARALDGIPLDLRPSWPLRRLSAGAAAAALLALALALRPAGGHAPTTQPDAAPADGQRVQSLQASAEVRPPAYMQRPTRRAVGLELKVEEGAEVKWELRFARVPDAVRLRFVDGAVLELADAGGAWQGARRFQRSTVYRIEADAAPLPDSAEAHRLEVIPDRAPQLTVSAPERTLSMLGDDARHWNLAFEAIDDYGLGAAELELTLAQGSGEQVAVSERRVALRGRGDSVRRRYEHRIDLAALGFAPGDDLVARLRVGDNRVPQPNQARSASYILRWPPERGAEGSGVEGLVQKTLPAYFRSQRQIVIDIEALLPQRGQLAADEFTSRSDAIGADQRLLRLRYGEFLGEEAEDAEHSTEDDGHAPPPGADAQALIAAAGHLHDIAEAATLLDPRTRALLREALRAMWQSEGELRTGRPGAALPHAYRALERVKQVQQSNRIYLARVGLELPALDPQRRLTGTAPAAGTRADPLAAPLAAAPPEALWHALQQDAAALPFAPLLEWLQAQPADADALDLLAALDAVRMRPDCRDCRARLARRLWPRLRLPAAAPAARPAPDAGGRAYLDALHVEPSR